MDVRQDIRAEQAVPLGGQGEEEAGLTVVVNPRRTRLELFLYYSDGRGNARIAAS